MPGTAVVVSARDRSGPLEASSRTNGAHATQPVPVLPRIGPRHPVHGKSAWSGSTTTYAAVRRGSTSCVARVVSATSATSSLRAVSVCRRETAACCHSTPACLRYGILRPRTGPRHTAGPHPTRPRRPTSTRTVS